MTAVNVARPFGSVAVVSSYEVVNCAAVFGTEAAGGRIDGVDREEHRLLLGEGLVRAVVS